MFKYSCVSGQFTLEHPNAKRSESSVITASMTILLKVSQLDICLKWCYSVVNLPFPGNLEIYGIHSNKFPLQGKETY